MEKKQILERRKGVTLLEMLIVIILFTTLMCIVFSVGFQTQEIGEFIDNWNDMLKWNSQAMSRISEDIYQSRVLYQNDATGQEYLTVLEVGTTFSPLTTSLLPVIDETGTFRKDEVGNQRTGNSILCAKEKEPFITLTAYDGKNTRCDVFSMVYYFISKTTEPHSSRNCLILVRWESVEYADYGQVSAITPVEKRSEFIRELYAQRGIRYLWDPRKSASSAFYEIFDDGSISALVEEDISIARAKVENVIDTLGWAQRSVAYNREATFWTPDEVPKFAVASFTGDGFPNGFEVQIIGQSGARQVLTRLVISKYLPRKDSFDSVELHIITNVREF